MPLMLAAVISWVVSLASSLIRIGPHLSAAWLAATGSLWDVMATASGSLCICATSTLAGSLGLFFWVGPPHPKRGRGMA